MDSLLSKKRKYIILFINISIIVTSFYFICTSEKIEKKISPNKYWSKKVKTYEKYLKTDRIKLKSLELELEKQYLMSGINEKQAVIDAEKNNEDFFDSYKEVTNEHLEKMKAIKNAMNKIKEEEKNHLENLNNAICQLDSR